MGPVEFRLGRDEQGPDPDPENDVELHPDKAHKDQGDAGAAEGSEDGVKNDRPGQGSGDDDEIDGPGPEKALLEEVQGMAQSLEDLGLFVGDDGDPGVVDDHGEEGEEEEGREEMEVRREERQPRRHGARDQGVEQGREQPEADAEGQEQEDEGDEEQADEPPEIAAAIAEKRREGRPASPVEEAAEDAAIEEDMEGEAEEGRDEEPAEQGRKGVPVLERGLAQPRQVHRPDARAEEGMTELRLDDDKEGKGDGRGEDDVDDVEDDQEPRLPERRPHAIGDGLEHAHGILLSSTS